MKNFRKILFVFATIFTCTVDALSKGDAFFSTLRAYSMQRAEYQEGFSEDTLVAVDDGCLRIDEMNEQSEIKCCNGENNQKVILVSSQYIPYLYEIDLGTKVIRAGPSQLFFDEITNDWIKAKDLSDQHMLGNCQVVDIRKINGYQKLYRMTTDTHQFLLGPENVIVHNGDIATICASGLSIGLLTLQHPVMAIIGRTISLVKMVIGAYELYQDMDHRMQLLQEAMDNEKIVLKTRAYYELRRAELYDLLLGFRSVKQSVLQICNQSSVAQLLFSSLPIYTTQSMLLPKISVELSYGVDDRAKLLQLREQELLDLEKEIEGIQIALLIHFNNVINQLHKAEDSYVKAFSFATDFYNKNQCRQSVWYYRTVLENILTLSAAEKELDKKVGIVQLFLKFYQHPANVKLLEQASNIADICSLLPQGISIICNGVNKNRATISREKNSIVQYVLDEGIATRGMIQEIDQRLYHQHDQDEQNNNKEIKIEQSQIKHAPPPNDPDPDPDDDDKYPDVDDDPLPVDNDSVMGHIFQKKKNHVPDTPENRTFLRDLVKDMKNYAGRDERFKRNWFGKINEKGKQWWAWVLNGKIRDGGLNEVPIKWNNETGFCSPIIPKR